MGGGLLSPPNPIFKISKCTIFLYIVQVDSRRAESDHQTRCASVPRLVRATGRLLGGVSPQLRLAAGQAAAGRGWRHVVLSRHPVRRRSVQSVRDPRRRHRRYVPIPHHR